MDSYPPDKNALYEACHWVELWIAIRPITSFLSGKNRIFLKFPTSTSTVGRYLWKLSLLHPCITCEFHQTTNHRLAVNVLLYEYRDLFIDMDVRNNRSELAIANRHQERLNFTRWKIIVHGLWLDGRCFLTSENLSFSVLIGWPERATPARTRRLV